MVKMFEAKMFDTKCLILNDTKLLLRRGPVCTAPVAQLVEHQAVTREVVSSTLAGPSLRVLK